MSQPLTEYCGSSEQQLSLEPSITCSAVKLEIVEGHRKGS